MTEAVAESIGPQNEIVQNFQQLSETCKGLLADYGKSRKPTFGSRFDNYLDNSSSNPTKLPTGKFQLIERDVFINGKREKIQVMSSNNGQMHIFQGDVGGERLVIQGSVSWIDKGKQPHHDINDDNPFPQQVRLATEEDLVKYREIVGSLRKSLIHGV